MTPEEWAAELAEVNAAFKRVGRMAETAHPRPADAPPVVLPGPSVFPLLVDLGYELDEVERDERGLYPLMGEHRPEWRDPMLAPFGPDETDRQGETA